jgi:hypothetical protein
MTTINPKQEIVRSLGKLNAVQSEMVLGFIQSLPPPRDDRFRPQHCKKRALREINQALQQSQASF